MNKRDATTVPCGKGRTIAVAALLTGIGLFAVACSDPPRQVALGQDIEIGPYILRVERVRPAPNPPPPISTFRSQPGKKGIVVYVDWKKLDDDMEVMRRLAFIESFIENQFSMANAEGVQTKVFGAMQAGLMYMQDPGRNWRDWVAVFHVPEDSKDLTLLVENPEPREGQARVTAIPLGM